MLVIRQLFGTVHVIINQFTTGLFQTGSFRVGTDDTGFQIFYPLFKRSDGYLIKLVHPDKEVLGEYFGRQLTYDSIFLFGAHFEEVPRVNTYECVLTVIQVIIPLADVKIKDTDGIHFLHFRVKVSQFDMLCDGFCYTEKDTFQIINLAGVLNFHNNDFVLTVAGLDVHTVEFIAFTLLVTLAFQYLHDMDGFAQQHGKETFENTEVGLVAQQSFHRPVKTYIFIFLFHNLHR